MSDRKVYTFTLHKEDDKDIINYFDKNKITKNVKKALRLLIDKEVEKIDKEQLLNIISILSERQSLNSIIKKNHKSIEVNNGTKDEMDFQTKIEFDKIIEKNNGMIGPIKLTY